MYDLLKILPKDIVKIILYYSNPYQEDYQRKTENTINAFDNLQRMYFSNMRYSMEMKNPTPQQEIIITKQLKSKRNKKSIQQTLRKCIQLLK